MSKRKYLNVSDLFKSLGRWNDLYGRVIALNMLVYSAGALHISFSKFLSFERKDFQFYDCDGIHYTLVDENVTFFSELKYGESRASFTRDESSLFMDVGELIGALLLVLLFRTKTSFQLTLGAMYILCPGAHLLKSKLFVRVSLFFSGVFAMMTSLPSIMHCMESLPKHLRLYGITIVLTSALVFNVWFWFFVRLVSFSIAWSHFMVAVGILVACLLHIRFAPPSIMHTLFNLDTVVLHKELKRWVPEDQLINIDDLVDHVLYRGPVFSSEMNAFAHLSQLGVFVRKTIICALLLPLGRLLSISAMTYEHRHISSGEFEGSFISTVITLLGYVITVVMNVKLGRRCTLAVAFVSAIFAQMTLLCTRMDMYNACWKMNTPKGWRTVLAYLAYTLTIISASIITVTARLTLVEHVPTSVRSIVAVAYFFSVFFCVSYLGYLRWLTLPKTYPNSTIIHSLGFTLMVAPFSLFIDNSDYLPISSSEIPAYSVPNRGYPVDQQPSDEPSEHMSARMMLDACAAAELTTEGASSTANE